ncbi:MAG: acyl-CoA dehydrogenase family protein [Saprospiraceae bacterium]
MESIAKNLVGGSFVVETVDSSAVFTPEDLNEEQVMFGDSVKEFIKTSILPNVNKIDKQETGLVQSLLEEAGEMGLLNAGLPEQYGGLGLDFTTECVLSENLGASHSWGVAVAAHTGIGTLPILYFGTEDQKTKYLPKLGTGKLKAAYCLTEPGSGSDALAAKTRADLSEDGKYYVLNGQKMWITNAGFADLFIVFAKIDGVKFTGFIVEADSEGITLGAEEDKMGIKGSSTRQVFFNQVKVPVENVLGDIGKGHKIAFNVLNIGRFKLCAMVMGGSKASNTMAIRYAKERIQFGVPIAEFGAIQYKLAEQAIRIFACESATYRVAGLIRDRIDSNVASGMNPVEAKLEAAEEYSIECALLKVHGSEVLDYVVDESVQIFGGSGFSEEYPVAKAYRDARINRIFEGTNEINRLLSVGMLLKKALKGELDLMTPAMAVKKELTSMPSFGSMTEQKPLQQEFKYLANLKKALIMVAGAAAQKYLDALDKEQEVMMYVSDMMLAIFGAESALLRTDKMVHKMGPEAAKQQIAAVQVLFADAIDAVQHLGRNALSAFAAGDELKMMLMGLKRFTTADPINTVAARRSIAQELIANDAYCF